MAGTHKRNTGPMFAAPRCGAKTRSGAPCKAPVVHGRARCRMHGGARGSGAPKGNRNALKDGLHTAEARAWRKELRDILSDSKALIEKS